MRHVNELFTKEEIQALVTPSNLRGSFETLVTWSLIAGILTLAGLYPSVWTAALAVVLLGGRMLGLAILMHDAAHRSLFRSRWLNDVAAQWLVAAPIWQDVARYRKHHLAHHTHTWTDRDPDLILAQNYPVSRASLVRKFARDLFGLTALKQLIGRFLMDIGIIAYTASPQTKRERLRPSPGQMLKNLVTRAGPFFLFHAVFATGLWLLGSFWLYGIWWLAWMTTYPAYLRLRAIAEHAAITDPATEIGQTRSTRAGLLAKLTVAPHNVNLHLEHHLLMMVPCYRLPAVHRRLKERGLLDAGNYAPSYWAVLRRVSDPKLPKLEPVASA